VRRSGYGVALLGLFVLAAAGAVAADPLPRGSVKRWVGELRPEGAEPTQFRARLRRCTDYADSCYGSYRCRGPACPAARGTFVAYLTSQGTYQLLGDSVACYAAAARCARTPSSDPRECIPARCFVPRPRCMLRAGAFCLFTCAFPEESSSVAGACTLRPKRGAYPL
jgi:hypothetical protein